MQRSLWCIVSLSISPSFSPLELTFHDHVSHVAAAAVVQYFPDYPGMHVCSADGHEGLHIIPTGNLLGGTRPIMNRCMDS